MLSSEPAPAPTYFAEPPAHFRKQGLLASLGTTYSTWAKKGTFNYWRPTTDPISFFPLLLSIFFFLAALPPQLFAQSLDVSGIPQRIDDVGYVDYTIPLGIEGELSFTLNGGDGGRRIVPNLCRRRGGKGATVWATFEVGQNVNQLKPGGVIRFVIGDEGQSERGSDAEGGGGGGSFVHDIAVMSDIEKG